MPSCFIVWFTRFILVSFVHMTVLPSWIWAMDSDETSFLTSARNAFRAERDSSIPTVAKHKQSDESLLFGGEEGDTCTAEMNASSNQTLWKRFLENVIGRYKGIGDFCFGIGIDEDDRLLSEASLSRHLITLPEVFSFSDLQTFFQTNARVQRYYPGLSLMHHGFTWRSKGYDFIFDFAGDLTFYAQNESVADFPYDEALRLSNPYGDVYVGANVPIHHLQVYGQNMFYQTKSSPIDRLDVWAIGKDNIPGIGCIAREAVLHTGTIYQHKGFFQNNGTLHNEIGMTVITNEGGLNKGSITSTKTVNLTTHGVFTNRQTIMAEQAMVLSGRGEIRNKQIMASHGMVSGTLSSFINMQSGTLSATGGFSDFTLRSFMNEGIVIGSGSIRVRTGVNKGIFTSEDLHFDVEESFVHEAIGQIKAERSLLFTGRGCVQQKGVIETPLLTVGSTSYDLLGNQGDRIQKVILTATNQGFEIGSDATFLVTDFEATEHGRGHVINRGDFMVRNRLVTDRSVTNYGQLTAQGWTHHGVSLVNKEGATIDVTGEAAIDSTCLENEGEWTFEGILNGLIQALHNKRKGILRFKKAVHLRNSTEGRRVSATNEGTLIAHHIFKWEGHAFQNNHRLFVYDNQINVDGQWYNTGFTRWVHNKVVARHHLNTGYMQRRSTFDTTETSVPKFTVNTRSDTTYKDGYFENVGVEDITDKHGWIQTVTERPMTHIDNDGAMYGAARRMIATTRIRNRGVMSCSEGHLSLEAPQVSNTVSILGKGSVSIKANDFDATGGRVSSRMGLTVQTDRLITDDKTLLENMCLQTRLQVKEGFTNKGTLNGSHLQFEGGHVTNEGTITGKKASFVKDVTNKGKITVKQVTHKGKGSLLNHFKGIITIGQYETEERLRHILNFGHLVIDQTDQFSVENIINYGVLSVQNGYYAIGVLHNKSVDADCVLRGGAHIVLDDLINEGQLSVPVDFKMIDMHGVTKLGKIVCEGKMFIEATSKKVNVLDFVRRESPNWQVKWVHLPPIHTLHLLKPLALSVGLDLKVTQFTNESVLDLPRLKLETTTFHNGTRQEAFGEIMITDEADITSDETLHNVFGKINVGRIKGETVDVNGIKMLNVKTKPGDRRGHLKVTSRKGSILNGASVRHGEGLYTNGAYMSAGLSVTLDAKHEVLTDFGDLISDDIMHLQAGNLIRVNSGRVFSMGKMVWQAPEAVIERSGETYRHYRKFNSDYWYDQYYVYPRAEGALVSAGGNLHFKVNGLTIRGSDVRSFGRIYDKNGNERTALRPGNFRLEACSYPRYATKDGQQHTDRNDLTVKPASMSSASGITFHFTNNTLAGGLMTAAGVKMRGSHLTLGFSDAAMATDARALGTGGRYGLSAFIEPFVAAGGAFQKNNKDPHALYGTGHSKHPAVDPVRVVIATEDGAKPKVVPTRQLADAFLTMMGMNSLFQRVLNKGYLFAHHDYEQHLDRLLENTMRASGNKQWMAEKDAREAQEALLTFSRIVVDGTDVLELYVTIPQRYMDEDLRYSTGIVADGTLKNKGKKKTSIDVVMDDHIGQYSSIIAGKGDVHLHSKGTRHSETIKHSIHFHDRKVSGSKEVARAQAVVKAGGELRDTSVRDFTSKGTKRMAGKDAVVGSLEGALTRDAVTCQSSTTTRSGGGGLFGGTERTTTESHETAFIADSVTAGGKAMIGSLRKKGHVSQTATHDTAGGDIHYKGKTGVTTASLGMNQTHTEATGTFRQTARHHETPTIHMASIMAGGNVINDFEEKSTYAGVLISAYDLMDICPITVCEPVVGVMVDSRSVDGTNGFGVSSRSVEQGQEVVVPMVIMLTNKLTSSAPVEAYDQSLLGLKATTIHAPGGVHVKKKRLVEEAYQARSWHTDTTKTSGLSSPLFEVATAHNPWEALVKTAVASTVAGSIDRLNDAQGDVAKGIAAIRVANSAVADAKVLANVVSAPDKAALDFLARFTSLSLGISSIATQMEAYQNMPTHIKTAWFQFDGAIWHHDDGAKLEATKVIVPNAELVTMRSGTHHLTQETTADSGSLGVNPLVAGVTASVGHHASTMTQTLHDQASILADYVFIRSQNMLVTGATVRSRVIDVMVEDDCLMESVVNDITQTQEGVSVGVNTTVATGDGILGKIGGLGDMAFSDKETKRRWIEEKTAFVATEQLYLSVGKKFVTRSAEAKRIGEDKAPPYYTVNKYTRNEAGERQAFYEREMPIEDHACAFYSFDLKGREGRSVRQTAVQLLLDHTHDEIIRNLIAFEIADHTRNEAQELLWQGAVSYRQLFQTAQNRLTRETHRVNRARGTALTAIQLLESDPTESDPELIQLQKRLEALDTAKATIREWASLETTVRDYITQHIGKPLVMLTYYNDVEADRPMTSTMDALATILGVNLEIYVQAYEEEIADRTALMKSKPLTLVHRFNGGGEGRDTKTIRMVNVAYDPAEPENLNHFNRLEETQDRVTAGQRDDAEIEGLGETSSGYDVQLPFATLATFAGNVADGIAWIQSHHAQMEEERTKQAYELAKQQGKTDEEAHESAENERQEVRAEVNVVTALGDSVDDYMGEEGSGVTQKSELSAPNVSDQDLQKWSDAFTIALNYDENLDLGDDFSRALTQRAKTRYQHYREQGFNDEQAWTNVRFEIKQSIRALESRPQVHTVVWGAIGKGLKVAGKVLGKLGKHANHKIAKKAVEETGKKVIIDTTKETLKQTAKGSRNPKVSEAAKKGRETHEKFKEMVKQKESKGWNSKPSIRDEAGKIHKPDALTPSGRPVELKPNTASGRAQGARQIKRYEEVYQKKGKVIYYEPF